MLPLMYMLAEVKAVYHEAKLKLLTVLFLNGCALFVYFRAM